MTIPPLGHLAVGKATRYLQEAFYKHVSEILVPDYYGPPTTAGLCYFQGALLEGINVTRWWLRYMWLVVEGDEWSEEGIQLEHFEEWLSGLQKYGTEEGVSKLGHHRDCKNPYCHKYLCTFHRLNAEQSLFVYNNYLDYTRCPVTGELQGVFYLDEPFY